MTDKATYRQHPIRIMISGGGTGGHIYPAIAIAQMLKISLESVDILFVGARGKMEMQKVPEAGFKIVGLWISGIQRSLSFQNLLFPIKLIHSILRSFGLLRDFKPHVVVGVGGFASGPLLYAATLKGIPTLIQEQNSYAGLTNKWLAGRVNTICVAYSGMEKFFPKSKLVLTGNPVRNNLIVSSEEIDNAFQYFDLDSAHPVLMVLGGSLGARTINESILEHLTELIDNGIQVIWQTGRYYHEDILARTEGMDLSHVRILDFIREMHYAYAVANVVISRAGALSLAELMLVAKPAILVPSPNVAEDHQTKNAQQLVAHDAAELVPDHDAKMNLVKVSLELLASGDRQTRLSKNIATLARPHAARDIANETIQLVA